MKALTFDKSRNLIMYARANEAGVIHTLVFKNSDGTPYSITDKGFQFILRKRAGQKVLFTLAEGSGLTVTGNELQIELSEANLTLDVDTYFYTLFSEEENHTWLNGSFKVHNGEFDGVEQTDELIIYENGSEVTITISGESSDQSLSVLTQTSTATLTPSPDYDAFELTAQDEPLTIANPDTDYPNFDGFMVRVTPTGSHSLNFGNKFRAQGDALPSSFTANKVMIITAIYDASEDKYDVRFSEEV